MVHKAMCCQESLINGHPAEVLTPLEQQTCQLRDGHVWLVRTLDQICIIYYNDMQYLL